MNRKSIKSFFNRPSFYIILASALLCLTIAVLPLFILNGKKKNTSNIQSDIVEPSFAKEEEPVSVEEEVSSVDIEEKPETAKRIAPKPENYVQALQKEEKVQIQTVNETPVTLKPTKLIDVRYINQSELYPSGCESVSAVMALNFMGYEISVSDFIDTYLDKAVTPYIGTDGNYYGYDPREYFLGDPYSEKGWGCKAPVIVSALNRCINHSKHLVENITGIDFPSLCTYIDSDIPVIIWATQGMEETRISKTWNIVDTDRTYTWIAPNHCLLLVGYDDTGYYFNDPLTHKDCRYPADIVENRYNSMGKQAIIITEKPPIENESNETQSDRSQSDDTSSDISLQSSDSQPADIYQIYESNLN